MNVIFSIVEYNLMMGVGLVIVILFLLVGNIRVVIIIVFIIFLFFLVIFLVMKFLGILGNLMSLGVLDFGIIVDGIVILIDNCVCFINEKRRYIGRKLIGYEMKEMVIDVLIEIRNVVGFG